MANVTRTTNWISGQVLTASALNTEFDNLLNSLNLVNADISSSAAIVTSKILFAGSNGQFLQSNGSGGINYVGASAINRAFAFSSPGTQTVANDVSYDPTSPQSVTAIKLWAYCKTAPTTASLIAQVFNITQSHVVATVTIAATGNSGSNASITNAAIAAGDVLRMDITQIGSGVAGADVTLVLEVTQP